MARTYPYIGADDLAIIRDEGPVRSAIHSPDDLRQWVAAADPRQVAIHDAVVVTFVITMDGTLWIADRHSEHVQCARGLAILSAGEMTFCVEKHEVTDTEVTNQSTGYCPEPESWPAVAEALDRACIEHPEGFTTSFVFRRCEACGMLNIVKEGEFVCAVCQADLPHDYNCSC